METNLEIARLKLEEQRNNDMALQKKLAEKVILLEENIDHLKEQHEVGLNKAEFSYR